MPPISTNIHFGKLFIENLKMKIDVPSFIIGIASPETIDEDDFEDLHTLDEDGNIDVREFYEQFNFEELSLKQKSFVLGYYCHVWLDEYYKFNASKLRIRNSVDLTDEELGNAVKSILRFYDDKAIDNFFESYKNEIDLFDLELNLTEIEGISIKKSKEKIMEFFKDSTPDVKYPDLIDEYEYMNFIENGCSKIMRSL